MKNFIVYSPNCYNVVFVSAETNNEAFEKAKELLNKLDKYHCFELSDVHELQTREGKTNIYRNTDNVVYFKK